MKKGGGGAIKRRSVVGVGDKRKKTRERSGRCTGSQVVKLTKVDAARPLHWIRVRIRKNTIHMVFFSSHEPNNKSCNMIGQKSATKIWEKRSGKKELCSRWSINLSLVSCMLSMKRIGGFPPHHHCHYSSAVAFWRRVVLSSNWAGGQGPSRMGSRHEAENTLVGDYSEYASRACRSPNRVCSSSSTV